MNNIILSIMIPVYNQEDLILRSLESIPKRSDIELLIIDDNSTDNTVLNISNWINKNNKEFGNILFKKNKKNMGCGFGKNWAYTNSQGKFIITIDSDDYVYTNKYNEVINKLYYINADIIFIGNDVNNGEEWTESSRKATWSYFIKNNFLKTNNLNYDPEARRAGDFDLTTSIQQLQREEVILKDIVYHYNYPRKGSIVWNYENGIDENMYRYN